MIPDRDKSKKTKNAVEQERFQTLKDLFSKANCKLHHEYFMSNNNNKSFSLMLELHFF